jgi:hypothetical protein
MAPDSTAQLPSEFKSLSPRVARATKSQVCKLSPAPVRPSARLHRTADNASARR